ncbi:hypothetical protein [Mycobacteroides abscessus]|uniref:hypothetical protein n=1 Tax=Mycobacteroides abscessus TaxID=36809 RepID=UPI0019D28167|nr:hypothetical protein [Mycobacteroides abscessus]QSN49656.1 hypothetical protein I3U33_26080 [Mycobacteroides abscessus subsp. abscessus]
MYSNVGGDNVFFTHDAASEQRWPAIRFGDRWNGFVTPVVYQDVAEKVLRALDEQFTVAEGATIVGADFVISPNANGEYDLASLGFTFGEAVQEE